MIAVTPPCLTGFIDRWKKSGGSEQANSQLFLAELCDVLELPRPALRFQEHIQPTQVKENICFVFAVHEEVVSCPVAADPNTLRFVKCSACFGNFITARSSSLCISKISDGRIMPSVV